MIRRTLFLVLWMFQIGAFLPSSFADGCYMPVVGGEWNDKALADSRVIQGTSFHCGMYHGSNYTQFVDRRDMGHLWKWQPETNPWPFSDELPAAILNVRKMLQNRFPKVVGWEIDNIKVFRVWETNLCMGVIDFVDPQGDTMRDIRIQIYFGKDGWIPEPYPTDSGIVSIIPDGTNTWRLTVGHQD